MAIKKSELYNSLWESCDQLRGNMNPSEYKDYILVLLFIKYISDKAESQKDSLLVVPPEASFNAIRKLKGKTDIGVQINSILKQIASKNNLDKIIETVDFNNNTKLGYGKELQERLTKLIAIFENEALDFSKNRAGGDDLLGDAYEYLMRNFATQSGKSKGEFYTPAEVSRVIAKIIGIDKSTSQTQSLYDPTCGSGSLLLKAADEAPHGISIYGQEKESSTCVLAQMNMILHNQPTAIILQGNTLSDPQFKEVKSIDLKTFDFAVANPPFSFKAWTTGVDVQNDPYRRFDGFGIPPKKRGDYAFLLHLLRSLKSTGKGAIILPHGVLFRGNAEGEIRKNIIERGYIKGIIGLPPNLFYGTPIPACIIVFDKENASSRKSIFMIDAGKGFVKDGNKNRLREQDIHKIVDVFNNQTEIPRYSRMISTQEIKENAYTLNIPQYVDTQEPEDIHDIQAHLSGGGIPTPDIDVLNDYWTVFPSLKNVLFAPASDSRYYVLQIPQNKIKSTIFSHPEFTTYTHDVTKIFDSWRARQSTHLKQLDINIKPKEVIRQLSEDLLHSFESAPLIDAYDVYQHLMTYWIDTMQDDLYIISVDGWKAEPAPVKNKKDEFDCDLLPKTLVIVRYFEVEQKALQKLEVDKDDITRQKEEMEEEHGGEEGILELLKTESVKIKCRIVSERIKEIKNDADATEELHILKAYMSLLDQEAETGKKIKDARADLDRKAINRYKSFTPEDIKSLVVDDKWMTKLSEDIMSELERVSQRLTRRILELAERYEVPLSRLNHQVEELTLKVDAHLKRMGLEW